MANKTLTEESVEYALKLLLEASPEGKTTNLHIKNLLRYLGYHAEQREVSNFMEIVFQKETHLCREQYYDNGSRCHCVYFWEEPDIEDDEDESIFDFTLDL